MKYGVQTTQKESDFIKVQFKLLNNLAGKLKLDKKLILILAVGMAGILLLMASEFWGGSNKKSSSNETTQTAKAEEYTYAQDIEKKLTNLISSIEGVGKTQVMVTLENGVEQVYADKEKIQNSSSSSDDSGSSKLDESLDREKEYIVLQTADGSENGLIIKVIQPQIRGVAIVCQGGASSEVKQNIVQTVTAVLNISSNRVYIAKMANE